MYFNYDGNNYEILIERKIRNKNTYFRVKEDLKLYVTTNTFVSDKEILRSIDKIRDSIIKMYDKQIKKNSYNDSFYYLGNKYDVVYVNSNGVEFVNNRVFIGKNIDIDKWLKRQAKIIFKERFDFCYNNFSRKIPYPDLRIRKMKTRWGVCNYKDIVVTLNLELIKKDISCLDYVIYHELSHLIEANHSKRFWDVVGENCPNYKNIRKIMKNY